MFNRGLNDTEAAIQISVLINAHNKLKGNYSPWDILREKETYIVEAVKNTVLGAIQIQKQAYVLSEIKHLVVRPECRKAGMAKHLIKAALNKSTTPIVYATIRQENVASIRAFNSCGFKKTAHYDTNKRSVLVFMRTSSKWLRSGNKNNEQGGISEV